MTFTERVDNSTLGLARLHSMLLVISTAVLDGSDGQKEDIANALEGAADYLAMLRADVGGLTRIADVLDAPGGKAVEP